MIITILTLFPEIFPPIFSTSIIGRAQKKGLIDFKFVNMRDYGIGSYRIVDDKPYGGGVGMLLRTDVVDRAIKAIRGRADTEKTVLLDPQGKTFNQRKAKSFSGLDHLILICGHYEGFDYRIHNFVDESISIGNYILTGGEIPAMVVCDSIIRLLPGVLTNPEAVLKESFTRPNLLESPQYTRPRIYKGLKVPKVLLSGNHQSIINWRKNQQKLKMYNND